LSAPDVQQALTRTLALVAELLGLPTGWVWLFDAETQQFYSAAVQNLPPYLQEPVRMTGSPCWCIKDFQQGHLTARNVGVLECSRLRTAMDENATEETHGLRYHASVPLYFQDQPLGIMNLTGPSWRKLTPRELRLLSIIAYQVGIAVERARLAEESTRLARAEERARLAREIHDTLAQGLTAIALHLEGALRYVEQDPERTRSRLQRALDMTRESLEEARRSVLNLRAAPLAGRPLPEALRALTRAFTAETGVRASVRASTEPALTVRAEAELFRIAQEALTNVRKHAQAREVTVTLSAKAGNVTLAVRDDGKGFDTWLARGDSHGILGMRERAKLLGGKLRVVSPPGRGTTVIATAPLGSEDQP